jgi:hypothetical protein
MAQTASQAAVYAKGLKDDGPGLNKFTRKYLSNFFKSIH